MDANTIRILLIVVGVLLIFALYLWERGRHAEHQDDEDEEQDEEDSRGADGPYGIPVARSEPRLGSLFGSYQRTREALRRAEEMPASEPAARSATSEAETAESETILDRPAPARVHRPVQGKVPVEAEPAPRPLATSSTAGANAPVEPLLIQVSVVARRAHFAGGDLMGAAADCGLRPGRMDIFHCLDEFEHDTRVYFSVANMVKPGTFPFGEMDMFSTPGVLLFAQLDGRPEDMTILEEMIATARKLATELDGDVLDESRRPLTVRKEEMLRAAVLENERRWARVADL